MKSLPAKFDHMKKTDYNESMRYSVPSKILVIGIGAFFFLFLLFIFTSNSTFSPPSLGKESEANNLLTIFLTGLLTGGLTCLAVQGGLLAASLAQREQEHLAHKAEQTGNALPIISFLVAKLAAYTLLGFTLGWLGSIFQLSITTQIIMQVAVAIFMVGTALNLLNVHPIFRYFIIQPPKFLTRIVRKQSKSGDIFSPAILGALTVFIPCGTTQAMMALAVGSGNPILGAAILFTFVLGTSPVFFILGYFATKLGETLHARFMKAAAIALIVLAAYNLNGTLALAGSPVTFDNLISKVWCTATFCNDQALAQQSEPLAKNITIEIQGAGYSPNNFSVKAGSSVTLNVVNTNGRGCIQAFTIPKLGIQKIVPVGSSETITFTAPSEPGALSFMCSMGMFRGVINVI